MRFQIRLTLIVFVYFCLILSANASPLDLYGLGSRSISRGNAATASADDYSVIFYNPGRMGFVKNSFGVNLLFSFDNVNIKLKKRPTGYDVPENVYNALPIDPDATGMKVRYMPTSELLQARGDTTDDPNNYTLAGGIVHDFGLWWFKAGVAFSIPLQSLTTADFHYVDEREQFFSNRLHFQLLNRKARRPTAMAGLAFRPLDWFGFGATINVFGNMDVKTRMFIPDALDQENIHFLMDAEIKYDAAVTVGVQFEPTDWMGIGLSFRDRSWFDVGVDNKLQFWNFEIYEGEPITKQSFDYSFSFSPRVLSGGLRFDVGDWSISSDAAWYMWSEFRPEFYEGSNDGFNDTYIVRIGTCYSPLDWLDVSFGGGWIPSPVPNQDGRTNYVDNDKVELALGSNFNLPWVEGLSVDFHTQFQILLEREQKKSDTASNSIVDEFPDARDIKTDEPLVESAGLQTNNPGFPGYTSSGFVGSVGIGVNYAF